MSGTSLDGLDICGVDFWQEPTSEWSFKIRHTRHIPYTEEWKHRLMTADQLLISEYAQLDTAYGIWLAAQVKEFLNDNNDFHPSFIASHGHTICHRPDLGYTVQLGNGLCMAEILSLPVVYDFRSQDVALGGQGAPLVPFGDRHLFHTYDACINLGGFSNISFEMGDKRLAFDICPVNIGINYFAQKLGRAFDAEGILAKSTAPDSGCLSELNGLTYYEEKAPKSLGREWVEKYIFPILSHLEPKVAISTLTHHAADQISKELRETGYKNVLFTGGGSKNTFLMHLIQKKSPGVALVLPEDQIVEYKEALIFAFLGLMKLLGKENIIPESTGAAYPHSTGLIAYPRGFPVWQSDFQ